jgi:hypothetical protein
MYEPFEEPPVNYTSHVYSAERAFTETEQALFETIGDFTNNPHKRRNVSALHDKTQKNRQAFNDFVSAIVNDEELAIEEKANSVSTVYCDAENRRLAYFRELAPDGDYEEGETSVEEISENIGDLFHNDLPPEDITLAVTNNYMLSLAVDLDILLDFAQPGKLARSITFARDAREHALEVGKTSAAIAIGAVIAHQVIKKLDR